MKVALITDTHWGKNRNNEYLIAETEKFMINQVFPEMKRQGINKMVHLGDINDNRINIGIKSISSLKSCFMRLCRENNIELEYIIGNHDCLYSTTNSVNSPKLIFEGFDFNIYSEPTEVMLGDAKVLFLPWINPENAERSYKMIEETDAKYCFGHLEIAGFKHGGTISKGLSMSVFSKFDLVCSGHFHGRQKIGNIYYIGNHMPLDFGEVDNDCGFHIFDTETGSLEFIPNEEYRHFIKMNYIDGMSVPNNMEGKSIRLYHGVKESETEFEKFVKGLQNTKPYDLELIDSTKQTIKDLVSESVEDEIEKKDIPDIIVGYVDKLDSDNVPDDYKEDIKEILLNAYRDARK